MILQKEWSKFSASQHTKKRLGFHLYYPFILEDSHGFGTDYLYGAVKLLVLEGSLRAAFALM